MTSAAVCVAAMSASAGVIPHCTMSDSSVCAVQAMSTPASVAKAILTPASRIFFRLRHWMPNASDSAFDWAGVRPAS